MATSICAFDHKAWSAAGLAYHGDFADYVTMCNEEPDGFDVTRGNWFYAPDEPLSADPVRIAMANAAREGDSAAKAALADYDQDNDVQPGIRVIYHGSWGNYNSPGADSCTHATLYDMSDPDDVENYAHDLAQWESFPEWIEREEEEIEEEEKEEEYDD